MIFLNTWQEIWPDLVLYMILNNSRGIIEKIYFQHDVIKSLYLQYVARECENLCLKNYHSNYHCTKASTYVSPKVSIFMKWNWSEMFFQSSVFSYFISVFSFKNYCHWFVSMSCTLIHYVKKHCQKQWYKSQWNWNIPWQADPISK